MPSDTRQNNGVDQSQNGIDVGSRRAFLGLGSAAALGSLAGCLGDDDNGNGNGNGNGGATDDSGAGDDEPEKPDQITVRAWGGVWEGSLEESIAEPFTEETGIDVQFDNTDRTVMQGDIRTAIQQDREPPVNVMWTVEPAAHEEYRMDLAEPLDESIVTNIDEMFNHAIPDVDDSIPYLTLYSYTYALSYNEDALEDITGSSEPPESWNDIKSDEFENAFGQYDNAYGFWPVFSELSDTPLDSDDLSAVYDEIEEFEPTIGHIGDDTSLTEQIREGEIACAPLIMNNLLDAYEDGEPVGWTLPEEGATLRGDSMYTPQNQSESELYWSQVFINFAAAAEHQSEWTESLGLPMTNSNTEPMDYMIDDPSYPTDEEDFETLLTVDLDVYAEESPEWFEEFNIIMGA
ncbi:ABC transporter substrate-binding protein [Natrarchaeobius halalkaliphilus]|nr:extracellular solute-binding protein [Natrarchaeobius halalkaliphilus]